jgi:hypothetical protein
MPKIRTFPQPKAGLVENIEISANSPALPAQEIPRAAYPEDSILGDFIAYARTVSEAQDSILIGSILPVVAGLLARRVFLNFGSKKYANVYNMIVARPGERKSFTVNIAQEIAARLLPENSFVWGVCSDQALVPLDLTDWKQGTA